MKFGFPFAEIEALVVFVSMMFHHSIRFVLIVLIVLSDLAESFIDCPGSSGQTEGYFVEVQCIAL